MAINREMEPCILEVKEETRTPSKAVKEAWKEVSSIEVAIYENDDRINTQSVRFNSSSHTGLTYCKDIKEGRNRLRKGEIIYNILSCKTKGRLTTLLLKVVDTDV
ncbi:MAG: hypothetical protein RSA01_00525 [Clostridium sp.]|uniref:hypothetical protein n=1 Tax=Clostridium sp. TaxID=1506 RepID=UPI002FCA486D